MVYQIWAYRRKVLIAPVTISMVYSSVLLFLAETDGDVALKLGMFLRTIVDVLPLDAWE